MFDIRYAIYLIIFSMPLYLVRFSVFGIPTTLLEVMIYILFLAWMIKEKGNIAQLFLLLKSEQKLAWGIILLFSGLFLSTYFSNDLRTSLGIAKGWFVDPFLFFLVFIDSIKNENDIANVLKSWAFSGLCVAIIGLLYVVSGNLTFDGRLVAFYISANYLAMYLAPALLIFIYFLFRKEKILVNEKKSKELVLSAIIVLSVAMIFTRSYGAMFSSIFAIIYFAYPAIQNRIKGNKKEKRKYVLIFLVLVFLLLYLGYAKLSQIQNSNGRSSFHSRLIIWDASLEMIKESPIAGIGPGTFQEKYLSLANNSEPYLEWAVTLPHNLYLAFYLETGLLGFLGFLIIVCWVLKTARRDDISKLLMMYVLIHGLTDTTYWKNDLSIMFWLVVALALSEKYIQNEKRAASS